MIQPDELVRAIPVFSRLPQATIRTVARLATPLEFSARQVLYRAGDKADGLYLILSGRVRVSRVSTTRSHLLHAESGGGVLGEIPVFGGGPFPATAVAITRTRCARLDVGDIERHLLADPAFVRFALHRLASRARSLLTRIDELTVTTTATRLARFVLDRSAASPDDFALGMSQEALAEEMGTAREVVVRSIKSLVDAGAIRRTARSRFAVARVAVLESLAGPKSERR